MNMEASCKSCQESIVSDPSDRVQQQLFYSYGRSRQIPFAARWVQRGMKLLALLLAGLQPVVVFAGDWYWTGVKLYEPPANPAEWGIYYPGHWARRGYWPTLAEAASKTCKSEPASHRLSDAYEINWIKPATSGVEFGLRAHMNCDWRNGLSEFYGLYFDKPCAEGEHALHFSNGSIFCAIIDYDGGRNLGAPRCVARHPYSPVGQGTNPINIATGNKYERVRVIPAQGHIPGLELHYNSQRSSGYPHLKGRAGDSSQQHWTHTFEGIAESTTLFELSTIVDAQELAAVDGALVQTSIYLNDGRILRFENRFDSNRRSTAKPEWDPSDSNVGYQLVTLEGGTGTVDGYRLTGPRGDYRDFDSSGRWRRWSLAHGETLTLEYSSNNRLSQVSDEQGKRLLFEYDPAGSFVGVTDSAGHVVRIEWNQNGDLVRIVFPDSTPDNDVDNPQRSFLYEDARYPAYLTGIINERGDRAATWAYDDMGRALRSEHAEGTDRHTLTYHADGTTTIRDPLGQERRYTFEVQRGVKVVSNVEGGLCAQCGGDASSYQFDTNGHLERKTDYNENATVYVYGADGLEISRTEAAGTPEAHTVNTVWDATIRKPIDVQESARRINYTYNTRGQVLAHSVIDSATGTSAP